MWMNRVGFGGGMGRGVGGRRGRRGRTGKKEGEMEEGMLYMVYNRFPSFADNALGKEVADGLRAPGYEDTSHFGGSWGLAAGENEDGGKDENCIKVHGYCKLVSLFLERATISRLKWVIGE